MRLSLLLFLVVFLNGGGFAQAAGSSLAPDISMVPHKALYNIEMVSKSSGTQILNISGQMYYEWRPGCDAWTTDHRFNLLYEYTDSLPIRITSDFSTYEAFDGTGFDFTSRRKRNGVLYQEVRGRADKVMEDITGQAIYTIPDNLVFDLDKGTLFPMAHSLNILEKAQKGEKFYSAVIFDGSDEEGPVEVNSFIGRTVKAADLVNFPLEVNKSLIDGKAWKIRMAFFPLLEPMSDSEYEMDVIFHESGVISDMKVEYRDFSVVQKLVALVKLENAHCEESQD